MSRSGRLRRIEDVYGHDEQSQYVVVNGELLCASYFSGRGCKKVPCCWSHSPFACTEALLDKLCASSNGGRTQMMSPDVSNILGTVHDLLRKAIAIQMSTSEPMISVRGEQGNGAGQLCEHCRGRPSETRAPSCAGQPKGASHREESYDGVPMQSPRFDPSTRSPWSPPLFSRSSGASYGPPPPFRSHNAGNVRSSGSGRHAFDSVYPSGSPHFLSFAKSETADFANNIKKALLNSVTDQ